MTTYYVDGVDGNDSNAGTSEGSGNAWATVDKAMNTVAAADLVYIKGNGTYSETPNIDTAGGTTGNHIRYEGYTTTPGDNGKATISGTTNCLTTSVATAYHQFKNLIFTGASSHGISGATLDDVGWFNCEFTSNGGDGANVDQRNYFVNCVFHSNTNAGLDANGQYTIGCTFYGNGDDASKGNLFAAYRNVYYGIPASKQAIDAVGSCQYVLGCTFDGEGNASNTAILATTDTRDCFYIDNIIYDFDMGISNNTNQWHYGTWMGYNLMNSNNTDYNNAHDNTGYGDVTSAPAFTDEAGDDYTLQDSSDAAVSGLYPGGIT